MFKKNVIMLLIVTTGCNICYSAATAEDKNLLKEGWSKYNFREFDAARAIFTKIQDNSKDKASICQAKTGLAFYFQFGQRGNVTVGDFEKAIELYEECIKIMGPEYKLIPFWQSMKAECLYRIYALNDNVEKLEAAQAIWKDINDKYPNSLIAQDALLFRTVIPIRDFTDKNVPAKISEMENYLKPIREKLKDETSAPTVKNAESSILAGVMANYLGKLYASRKEFRKSSDNYDTYVKLGPTSHHYKLGAYYSIARIADVELEDKTLAMEYYTRIFTESPTDRRSYYSMQRVKQLGGTDEINQKQTPKNKEDK